MKILLIPCLCIYTISAISKQNFTTKHQFCAYLNCNEETREATCGIRVDTKGVQLRFFESVCELLKYGCQVEDEKTYGLINIDYCKRTFKFTGTSDTKMILNNYIKESDIKIKCAKYDCSKNLLNTTYVCGIRKDNNGFIIRLFNNECLLQKHNCENNIEFIITDSYICDGLDVSNDTNVGNGDNLYKNTKRNSINRNIFIVDGLFNYNSDINDTVDTFFASTHVFDLPVKEIPVTDLNIDTRRIILNRFGPQKVFKPWITIPKNISDDHYHRPTLSSCYHKCPKKCPETYAPVCGVPGIVAREPSLMFQNHCFMDIAQCKMFWEDKSDTAISSSYIESSFLFCLGDEMNGLYRFLPLVRTLQHMGRLKKKGHFRYKLSNLRFFNNLLSRQPKLMG
ncbi:uncharacterized protein LOC131846795 [Achroia grisella]|uniref:uncharacterized protein LOC131846795 n=1 Tax=Achroia grisella TaxID=688607 RepID=UPI0027D21534|nr:uncharacterized protein LOC131846795 [Achroia grisella]